MAFWWFSIPLADDKESLLKQKNSLSNSKKREKRTGTAKKKKLPQEDQSSACNQTKKKKQKKKGCSNNDTEGEDVENEEKERKRKEDKEKRERNRKEKEKRQNILTARVDNLVARMNDNMDDRFGSELISQCCEILSSNCSRESEDEADHLLMQHPEGRKDSGTPLSVTQRPSSSQPEPAHQFPSLDRNVEADLAELIQHQDARKAPSTPFVSGVLHSQPCNHKHPCKNSLEESSSPQYWGSQGPHPSGQLLG